MTSASFLVWERRTTAPSLVFDLVDELLAERRTADRRTRPRGRSDTGSWPRDRPGS